ncbi:amino oxidase [Emticicia aquatilis]|uniref:Amino oxidase n=1 Tax=Emticicia aquatilis TaxID=1537369 RepID=A0A917DVD8_9BACT|nr:FAD/NAD(P)-binding protein [Emticicia aquatilis]GGD70459.1 amino oxidase [Emticicia aquatilis]
MGKSDVSISRKEFLELSGIALLGSTLGLQTLTSCESATVIQGQIVGANHAIGHLLRKAISLPIHQSHQTKILIVGSGISGLTAGYFLQKAGIKDYEILELESHIGGNSTFGEDEARYPWAAHYLPIPSPENKELIDFLAENKIITGFDENKLPVYDEYALCFHPDERLFVKGFWQEGLIPNMDILDGEKNQIGEFLSKMNAFKTAKGNDQKWAFTIPLAYSSSDTSFTDLDKISMKTWMERNAFTAKPLHWYVNYCLLDDYGTSIAETSAWAGIHYFASRKGKAANAKDDDVLTWSEGNGFLMKLVAKNQLNHIKTQRLAYQIEEKNGKVSVDVYDWKTEKRENYTVEQVIWAVPQMLRPYLMPQQKSDFIKDFTYSPWMVANIQTKPFDTGRGQALSWDNVIYEGNGLGYVLSNHQELSQDQQTWQLTYYKPLVDNNPADERKKAIVKTHEEWKSEVLTDLKKAHPKIEESILKIDIKLWGHAMIRPTIGFIHGSARYEAQKSLNNKIHFAHSDLSGVSIFEEAFYHGAEVAKKVISNIYHGDTDYTNFHGE